MTYNSKIDFDRTGDPEWPSIPRLVITLLQRHVNVVCLYDTGDADDEAETEEGEDCDSLFGRQLKTHDEWDWQKENGEVEYDGDDSERHHVVPFVNAMMGIFCQRCPESGERSGKEDLSIWRRDMKGSDTDWQAKTAERKKAMSIAVMKAIPPTMQYLYHSLYIPPCVRRL